MSEKTTVITNSGNIIHHAAGISELGIEGNAVAATAAGDKGTLVNKGASVVGDVSNKAVGTSVRFKSPA